MKKILLISIILFFIAGVICFARDDEYDTDLFDIPDDFEVETEEAVRFTEETFSLYGYLVNFLAIDLIYADDEFDTSYVGNVSYLRLKGDWNPADNISFHAEVSYDAKLGNQNPYILFEQYGMVPPGYQAAFPQDDFIQTLNIDHFYGKLNIGQIDIQFGKMPIAWGTGYAFNPTQKVSLAPFMDTIAEETPGTYGIAPSFSIIPGFSLDGYVAFQDKSHKTTADIGDGDWENIPYGIKVIGITGSFDLSVSWIKEVLYAAGTYNHSHYIGADFAGGIWDIGVYGEAVLNLPVNEDEEFDFEGHEADELIEACIGFYYTIPIIEVDARGEYYHQGAGTSDKNNYDFFTIMSGERVLQAEDYIFFFLDKTFLDFYRISAGVFINLIDGSCAIIPSVSYDMYDNFQVELGSALFFGEQGSEFYGEYDLTYAGMGIIDLIQPMMYLRCKLSF